MFLEKKDGSFDVSDFDFSPVDSLSPLVISGFLLGSGGTWFDLFLSLSPGFPDIGLALDSLDLLV